MITTRESLNYQFSLIFGYSSPNDFTVGNVIGPGKLTREKVNQLSGDVIKFLGMYNAILRDYTGSEVFSIEFQLFNYDEKDAQLNIYPKSMILIPGKYKDCESLLLALKAETGYLDTHKSKAAIDDISRLFLEVEEFTDHPDLGKEGKIQVVNNFAYRFSKKLYGELIEDKWNKKLIGISYSLPTEREMLASYASIKNDINFSWNKRPIEISLSNYEYKKISLPYEGQSEMEHLKYIISEASANFVVEKTLQLGSDLLKLANTGTIDEIQESIIIFLLMQVNHILNSINDTTTGADVIKQVMLILDKYNSYFESLYDFSKEFASTGESGRIDVIIEKYMLFIYNRLPEDNVILKEICDLTSKSIKISITKNDNIRASELISAFNYFFEISKMSIKLIIDSLPKFLTRRRLKTLIYNLISTIKIRFDKEQKPSKILGHNILNRFESFLLSQIETHPLILSKLTQFNEEQIIKEFKKLVIKNMKSFFGKLNLEISDLVGFAEIQMDLDSNLIKTHLEKFEKFSAELKFLLNYILRYSTINRFLKEEPSSEIADPVTFVNRFHRFLEKRFGGINLAWKNYILEWLLDYAKQFFKIEEKRVWSLKETLSNFMDYLKERESLESTSEQFLIFLDKYIAKIEGPERSYLIEFYKKLEHSIDIKNEFPKYIQNIIEKELTLYNHTYENLRPYDFFNSDGINIFYEYLSDTELQYFSKLIPRPVSIIFKHSLTEEEKKLFTADLFHVFNFKYWHNKSMYEISDNYKEVYREWLRNTG